MTGRSVILHLGGDPARAHETIVQALRHSAAWVVISSERQSGAVLLALVAAGVPRARIALDFAAWDTASNFTTTRARIRSLLPARVIVVTGARHMPRAGAIARLAYAGTGIRVQEAPFTGEAPDAPDTETWWRTAVDVVRTWIWARTGVLLSNPITKRRAMARIRAYAAEATPTPTEAPSDERK